MVALCKRAGESADPQVDWAERLFANLKQQHGIDPRVVAAQSERYHTAIHAEPVSLAQQKPRRARRTESRRKSVFGGLLVGKATAALAQAADAGAILDAVTPAATVDGQAPALFEASFTLRPRDKAAAEAVALLLAFFCEVDASQVEPSHCERLVDTFQAKNSAGDWRDDLYKTIQGQFGLDPRAWMEVRHAAW